MLIEKLDRGLMIRTPAKVNLFLEVLGKRADGYHAIDSVICPVTLCDELTFEANDSGRVEFSIRTVAADGGLGPARSGRERSQGPSPRQSIAGAGGAGNALGNGDLGDGDPAWNIPSDGSNLVVRALEGVRREMGVRIGCRVELTKRIPAAAGLGGGSSDAAAAIVAGLTLWGKWDRDLAVRVASGLGSDIPLFLGDQQNGIGLAWVTGRGEHVKMLSGRPPLCFVISHPPVGSSTAEVYKLWRGGDGSRSSAGMLAACAEAAADDLEATDPFEVPRKIEESLFNALQSPASQLTDWIARQLQFFARLGKPRGLMSGSGSACFTLVDSPDEGREIIEKLIAFGLPRAYLAQAWYAPPIEQQLERTFQTLP